MFALDEKARQNYLTGKKKINEKIKPLFQTKQEKWDNSMLAQAN